MDEAAVHAVDGLSGAPELLAVILVAAIIAGVFIKVIPLWDKHKRMQIDNEAKFKQAQIDLNRDREFRKMEEQKQRVERDKENSVLMSRSIEAQERSTIAINESTAQMAVLAVKLEISQQGSISMRETVDDMATEVHDIHLAVVK